MKKTVLISALALLWSVDGHAVPVHGGTEDPVEIVKVSAADRDCARYTAAQASEATSDDTGNTVGIVFSGKTTRKGLTNADCGVKAVEAESTDTGSSGGNEYGDLPIPEQTHSGGGIR